MQIINNESFHAANLVQRNLQQSFLVYVYIDAHSNMMRIVWDRTGQLDYTSYKYQRDQITVGVVFSLNVRPGMKVRDLSRGSLAAVPLDMNLGSLRKTVAGRFFGRVSVSI